MPTPDDLTRAYQRAVLDILERLARRRSGHDEALLREIRGILSELDQDALAWLDAVVPAQYQRGMTASLATLREALPNVAAHAELSGIHRSAVEALVANAAGDIREATARVGRHIEDRLRRAGLESATSRVAGGSSFRQAARQLAAQIAEEGLTPPGFMRPDAYAKLVANTTTREAQNLGRINTAREYRQDLVRMSSHASPCPICAQYEGRVYSISGSDPRYPPLYGTAFGNGFNTIHPFCGHSAHPYVERLADDPERDRARSNAPFTDNRSMKQKRAYDLAQQRKRRQRETRSQWERYRAALGGDVPGLASFASMKARDSEGYRELLRDYRAIVNG